jgi:hypothetical protein
MVKFIYYGIYDCTTISMVYPYYFHTVCIVWKWHLVCKLHFHSPVHFLRILPSGGAKLPKGPFSLPPRIVCVRRRCEPSTAGTRVSYFKIWVSEIAFPAFWEHIFKLKISASQNKVLMVKFVINCMLNIQTQRKFKYAHQQILFL